MSGFDFDFEAELKDIKSTTKNKEDDKGNKKRTTRQTSQPDRPKRPSTRRTPSTNTDVKTSTNDDGATSKPTSKPVQNTSSETSVQPARSSSHANNENNDSGNNNNENNNNNEESQEPYVKRLYESDEPVEWNSFVELDEVFEYMGGARPIQLANNIKSSQVSGLPDPLITNLQSQLYENYKNIVVSFPFGVFKIDASNKVFSRKTSMLRYLILDGYRDEQGSHLQYARQWLALHRPTVFTPDYNIRENSQPSSGDELDIYALLCAVYQKSYMTQSNYTGVSNTGSSLTSDADNVVNRNQELLYELTDKLDLIQQNVDTTKHLVHTQNSALIPIADNTLFLQAVLVADRMGLISGSLPRDVGDIKRVLEVNRETLRELGLELKDHYEAEKERDRRIHESRRKIEQKEQGRNYRMG